MHPRRFHLYKKRLISIGYIGISLMFIFLSGESQETLAFLYE